MSGFIGELANEFMHRGQGQQSQSQSQGGYGYGGQEYPQQQQGGYPGYGGGQPASYNGPPQVPAPWVAEWDQRDGRWIFINRETGHRTFNHQETQAYGGGYEPRGYQGGYQQQEGYYQEQQPQHKDHSGRNMALGVGAGVLGGALLMHEGEKVEEKWDEDKYRLASDVAGADNYVERKFDNGVDDVEDFPDDAARWTGRKFQEVEDIPQDIDNDWRDARQDVENVPEDVAGWAGRKVGDVERFDDNVEGSYDYGRDERRYEDDYRDDNY